MIKNQPSNKQQVAIDVIASDGWNIFFIEYKYDNFIHVSNVELFQLHLQLHLRL